MSMKNSLSNIINLVTRRKISEYQQDINGKRIETLETINNNISIEASKTAIVIVDMWNYHWCKTWVGRAVAMIPRMNKALALARELGIMVVHAPTDVANYYSGWEQRERMAALPRALIPGLDLSAWPSEELMSRIPEPHWWDGDMCGGAFECKQNYGEYKLHPALEIGRGDWISASGQDVYNLCMAKGIENLIYMGGATNICLVRKPEGMINMNAAGLRCMVARDLTEAHSIGADSNELDKNTEASVEYIERYLGASVDIVKTFKAMGIWKDEWLVDQVLVSPWGQIDYPQVFEESVNVTMSFPKLPEAEIRYTTDGSEPSQSSRLYSEPVKVAGTSVLRAAAFLGTEKVSLESESHYLNIPSLPPLPEVHISDLKPIWASVRGHIPWWNHPELGTNLPPVKDRSYDGSPLTLREVVYDKGMGVDSPSQLVYEIKNDYDFFVACAGVSESMLANDLGREIAAFAKVIFKVFIDGSLVAESRTMTISEAPWRFKVKIPEGSRIISLVTTCPGEGGAYNQGNWVNAGFLLKYDIISKS